MSTSFEQQFMFQFETFWNLNLTDSVWCMPQISQYYKIKLDMYLTVKIFTDLFQENFF